MLKTALNKNETFRFDDKRCWCGTLLCDRSRRNIIYCCCSVLLKLYKIVALVVFCRILKNAKVFNRVIP